MTTYRFAYNPDHGDRMLSTIRLALSNSPPERNGSAGFENPAVRLATPLIGETGANSAQHLTQTLKPPTGVGDQQAPALLVSYVYLEPFLKNRHRYHYRNWVMDSGAFSAHKSGKVIDLQQYIDTCKRLLAEDPTLVEVFALDVIGDHDASLANTSTMWEQGVPAIPCYHYGEPWVAGHLAAQVEQHETERAPSGKAGVPGVAHDPRERSAACARPVSWKRDNAGGGKAGRCDRRGD